MQICVLGAGTMGHGIAQVCAFGGHEVIIRDIDEEVLKNGLASIKSNLTGGIKRGKVTEDERTATLDRIDVTTDLESGVGDADVVIEAVPEVLDLKQQIFSDVEKIVSDDTLIATNTSSLSVTSIASVLTHPERSLGMHFFNPVHIMALVEIVTAEQTSSDTENRALELVETIDKTPIVVRDVPGFASSRLGVTVGVEAIRMVEQGVASAEDIDTAMTLGYNHPMGPLELTDLVGLDVRLDVLEYLTTELGERFRPPQLLKRKVRAGNLGRKTGEGFYIWSDGEKIKSSD